MAIRTLPNQEYLRQCFDYDHEAGQLIWRPRPECDFTLHRQFLTWNTRYAGKPVGTASLGYVKTRLNGVTWPVHRLIWKWMTGQEPFLVDHKDRDGTNNRWANLRSASHSENNLNSKVRAGSKSGFRGVTALKNGRFFAEAARGKIRLKFGPFDTAEEAHAAYCKAAQELHGEFWNPG